MNENNENDILMIFQFVTYQTRKQTEYCIAKLMNNDVLFFIFI